jgi:tetratricopeptide (TPR) repeat protein/predicted aspartyl protease
MFRALALAGLALIAAPVGATAACNMVTMAELPVTMSGLGRPLISVTINSQKEEFLADSGAFYSFITPSTASELHLTVIPTPAGYLVKGVGGVANASQTTVKQFTLAGVPFPNAVLLVAGGGGDEAGLLGQNVLGVADVDYDLAKGMIRLMHPVGCSNNVLAHWRSPPAPYSAMTISVPVEENPHTMGTVIVNGVRFRATFDTGAPVSFLSLSVAGRAGIKTSNAGVVESGTIGGIGRGQVGTWIAPVDSLEIGDNEKILHTRLRIADLSALDTEMVIGSDFFLSHRVYVANSQHRLYFTYNGGPVFNLGVAPQNIAGQTPAPASPPPAGPGADVPKDAAGFARVGEALSARQNYVEAISMFSKAIELAPGSAEYRVERAWTYIMTRQPVLAMPDVERALQLEPANVDGLVLRAQARLSNQNTEGAVADIKAAGAALPPGSERRLQLAGLYERASDLRATIHELDTWIGTHRDENALGEALNLRCWARALMGQELDKALSDCDASLRRLPKAANVLDSRGLVHLRLGDYDKAVADYDRALAIVPKNAWSLYGRGMAKLKLNRAAEGKVDISAAEAINPHIADEARKHGLTP